MFEAVSLLLQAAEALAILMVARAIRHSWGSQDEESGESSPSSIDDVME